MWTTNWILNDPTRKPWSFRFYGNINEPLPDKGRYPEVGVGSLDTGRAVEELAEFGDVPGAGHGVAGARGRRHVALLRVNPALRDQQISAHKHVTKTVETECW